MIVEGKIAECTTRSEKHNIQKFKIQFRTWLSLCVLLFQQSETKNNAGLFLSRYSIGLKKYLVFIINYWQMAQS